VIKKIRQQNKELCVSGKRNQGALMDRRAARDMALDCDSEFCEDRRNIAKPISANDYYVQSLLLWIVLNLLRNLTDAARIHLRHNVNDTDSHLLRQIRN